MITGGGAGIGHAAALQQLSWESPRISYVLADASSADDAVHTVSEVVQRHGRLEVLVNNAGAGAILPLAKAGLQQMRDIFATNVIGPSLLATAALPYLKAVRGTIVNISGTFGHKAAPALSHYAASKAALEHMTRCWALEPAADGVRVNAGTRPYPAGTTRRTG
ncbi:MAG TPA: SDR family oxidoreductase [Pseudoduganella sp.]